MLMSPYLACLESSSCLISSPCWPSTSISTSTSVDAGRCLKQWKPTLNCSHLSFFGGNFFFILCEAALGIVCGGQSRKPGAVPMIIETTSWQLIWEPASTPISFHRQPGRKATQFCCCGRSALPPRTLSTRFWQMTSKAVSRRLHTHNSVVANIKYEWKDELWCTLGGGDAVKGWDLYDCRKLLRLPNIKVLDLTTNLW